eukprot:2375008-Lingulodinium_polyedra.AAC.1
MTRLLFHLAERLEAADLIEKVPYYPHCPAIDSLPAEPGPAQSLPLWEVSYLDDMMFPSFGTTPEALLRKLEAVASLVINTISSYGFVVNLSR